MQEGSDGDGMHREGQWSWEVRAEARCAGGFGGSPQQSQLETGRRQRPML